MKIIILGAMLFVTSCQCERMQGISEDIKDSKNNGLIVRKIIESPKVFVFSDTLKLIVEEAWIEKLWTHECYKKIKSFENFRGYKYQLCVNTTKESLVGYGEYWEVGNSKVETFRFSSDKSLVVEIKEKDIENPCYQFKSILLNEEFIEVKSQIKICF